MSELLSLGVSHKTAPVEVRERLALDEHDAERLLRELTAHDEVHEAVAISTCNRTELYLVAGDPVQAEADALARLATYAGIRPTELAHVVYTPRNCDAACRRRGRARWGGSRRASSTASRAASSR